MRLRACARGGFVSLSPLPGTRRGAMETSASRRCAASTTAAATSPAATATHASARTSCAGDKSRRPTRPSKPPGCGSRPHASALRESPNHEDGWDARAARVDAWRHGTIRRMSGGRSRLSAADQRARDRLVLEARSQGATWPEIGARFHLSASAARRAAGRAAKLAAEAGLVDLDAGALLEQIVRTEARPLYRLDELHHDANASVVVGAARAVGIV